MALKTVLPKRPQQKECHQKGELLLYTVLNNPAAEIELSCDGFPRRTLSGRGVELVHTSWLEARNHLDHVALRSAAITTLGADCGTFDDTRLYKTIHCILLYLNLLAWHCHSHTYDGKSTNLRCCSSALQ